MENFNFTVGESGHKKRLDHFLKSSLPGFSRSQIQRWIKKGTVLLNGTGTQASYILSEGETVEGHVPPEEMSLVPENLNLEILFEDPFLVVVNKPSGMVAHPAAGNYTGTLANALAYHLKQSQIKSGGENFRVGLAHRLDRGTSGLLVVAKTTPVLEALSAQFKERKIEKVYRAIVSGVVGRAVGEIESPIGRGYRSSKMAVLPFGKHSLTGYKVLKSYTRHSYLEVYPKTGRTHQIRVHLAKIGHAVAGDTVYGKEEAPRLMLHAYQLVFTHPITKKKMKFTAPLPKAFQSFLKTLS